MNTFDRSFALLEAAAIAGERCPQGQPHGPIPSGHTKKLAEQGKIRIEIFRHNWRVVTILVGPNAGKETKACPVGGMPYMVVDHRRTERHLTHQERNRPGPSAPRRIA